ncbi:MAG TPA: DKNYY domain-containing protein [Burkholderiales bacterium]|nr:DKNYY domain-containing protein [Burkholderiales bacterium]
MIDRNTFAFRGAIIMGLLSFIFGCGAKESPFQQKDGAWYYNETLIAEADPKSFQVLSGHYAKDTSRVYYADTRRDSKDYFTTKRSQVTVVERADPGTFRHLNSEYAKDKDNVFFEGVAFPVKDIDSFELLDYGYARDRIGAYYHQRPIPGTEGSTFSTLDSHYSKDAKHVFYSDLEAAPGQPVRRSTQVRNALAASFVTMESGYAADAAHVYFKGEVLTDAVSTFRMLQLGYAKTATAVYYTGKLVQGADAASFDILERVTDAADARDRVNMYQQGRRTGRVQ